MADLERYPFRKSTSCRAAMAQALRDFVKRRRFALPKTTEPFAFAAVYARWAKFRDSATTAGGKLPAAAVLPDRPQYDADSMTPRMLEETWSGGDHSLCDSLGRPLYPVGDGSGDGFALFAIAELVVPFVLLIRASSEAQRTAIVSTLEDEFAEDGSLLDRGTLNPAFPVQTTPDDVATRPIRYGRLLELPDYYGRIMRLTLKGFQDLDTQATAIENRWLTQFELEGHAKVCVLRRVRAMQPRIRIIADDREEIRGGS